WLLLYGAGLATAGAGSPRLFPSPGGALLALRAPPPLGPPGGGSWPPPGGLRGAPPWVGVARVGRPPWGSPPRPAAAPRAGAGGRAGARPRAHRRARALGRPRPAHSSPAAPRRPERARRRGVAGLQRPEGTARRHRRQPECAVPEARGRPLPDLHQDFRPAPA